MTAVQVFSELHDSILGARTGTGLTSINYSMTSCPTAIRDIIANRDYKDTQAFAPKGFMNTVSAGKYSSGRAVLEYLEDIWGL